MLNFRPLQVAKRKLQSYNQVPTHDVEDGDIYNEKRYDSDDDESYVSSTTSSPYSSRVSSGVLHTRQRSTTKPTVSAYSYRNPRAFTRYFGLAIASTLILFVLFLMKMGWASARDVELGLNKPPPPPHVWEAFPFLKRYHGGIRTLQARDKNVPEYPRKEDIDPDLPPGKTGELQEDEAQFEKRSENGAVPLGDVFTPYPDYQSLKYLDQYGPVETCYLDVNDTVKIPSLRAYKGVPDGQPDNILGSYDVLGLRKDVCFERFGRLGPYGLGYSRKLGGTGAGMEGDREGIEKVWEATPEVNFQHVKWGAAQDRCLEKNRFRFKAKPKGRNHFFQTMATKGPKDETINATSGEIGDVEEPVKEQEVGKKYTNGTVRAQPKSQHKNLLPRTCVLIRTWWDYKYDDEDIMFLRALVSELSIQSGGEYVVHFLIHVKDNNKQIWADDQVYQETLNNSLPPEFEGMGTLWSEKQMSLIYAGVDEAKFRDLPVHGAYRSTFMPVTYFAHQHPEFDFFWQWEMDVRYTGHYYHLFSQVAQWADKQPRKGLWERNSRFYVPATHGSWEDFSHMVRVQTEHGTNSKANTWSSHLPPNPHMPEAETQKPEKPIWGPELPYDYPDIELDDAIIPPTTSTEDKYEWGVNEPADLIVFNPLFDPDHTNWILAEDVTGYNRSQGFPPRRTAINTSGRLSRRLLETMHREQSLHRHTMFSEMWPASCALHHGLKAVFAPHPVFIDRKWPVQYLAAIFNNGRNGASGGARLSIFSDERQHNFKGTTWYYDAGFAPNLWKRWLGYKVDNDGGEEEEVEGEGRMCLPGVLLHPVKDVELVFERVADDEDDDFFVDIDVCFPVYVLVIWDGSSYHLGRLLQVPSEIMLSPNSPAVQTYDGQIRSYHPLSTHLLFCHRVCHYIPSSSIPIFPCYLATLLPCCHNHREVLLPGVHASFRLISCHETEIESSRVEALSKKPRQHTLTILIANVLENRRDGDTEPSEIYSKSKERALKRLIWSCVDLEDVKNMMLWWIETSKINVTKTAMVFKSHLDPQGFRVEDQIYLIAENPLMHNAN
ncbi:uncharacterized protein BDR25DRAFT_395447 [Lindgomyces ingoldianus]|uniref:Uncharacterized protein n=1 Tax=Lindgomyces ingoldianus TaxID=673940 RepID=A0ACB6QL67_9PLEO|nr:uncharacterized protein BDR25DRAFT_395447 [Lindgomyces ingoldianus]KAF2466881.1 hypothetical protein BDR25DRAFT_395447 [Lindgomyces ingoldianus]